MAAAMAAAVLAGCGVEGNHDSMIRDAVANRVFLFQTPGAGDATLQVVRANGFFGGGCSSQIMIDDKFAAQLETGEQVAFNLPTGTHVVTLQNSGACRKPGDDARVELSLQPGESALAEVNKWGSSLSLAKR
ncbi:hypothetical protein DVT68_07045 [Dyella solisilvae]|uniref:DUF2846 domain-containing protein n=2 Tax=Dyella solisilvae TaxID=1920168 RepID=A0A370KD37_9GAMM|nr:hypothetical protein DVT68_07045 [Dyella solisilvae]